MFYPGLFQGFLSCLSQGSLYPVLVPGREKTSVRSFSRRSLTHPPFCSLGPPHSLIAPPHPLFGQLRTVFFPRSAHRDNYFAVILEGRLCVSVLLPR